jgi:predicted DNA-binding helix-hairpin-helix protein
LQILTADAQYDLACACGSNTEDARRRGSSGKWIYPVTLPNGGKAILFKTLMSNICTNDCKYCPLRQQQDIRRCSLSPDETAKTFLEYHNRREVSGLFLSSGVCGSPDETMEHLNATARLLRRRHGFRGYIHLTVIPGAGHGAIEESLSLADAVSLNIETPGQKNLALLSGRKDYLRDIIEPMKLISRLTADGSKYHKVKQTTQFIVGAAGESDAEIVKYIGALYDRLRIHRVYFSAYQRGLGDPTIPGEIRQTRGAEAIPNDVFTREHRLYQVDFLIRKYGFAESDIIFGEDDNLSLTTDPKQVWADRHPDIFPVDINCATREELLKVPGLGPITVRGILARRKIGRIIAIENIGKPGVRLQKAQKYLTF